MQTDFVIINAEFQIETRNNPYGHYILFRFIDVKPSRPKLLQLLTDISKNEDVDLIDYNYTEKEIDSKTNLDGLHITLH